jgi:hypothetical protein
MEVCKIGVEDRCLLCDLVEASVLIVRRNREELVPLDVGVLLDDATDLHFGWEVLDEGPGERHDPINHGTLAADEVAMSPTEGIGLPAVIRATKPKL